MLHRRATLCAMVRAMLAGPVLPCFSRVFGNPIFETPFHIGISDSLIHGQLNPAVAPTVLRPMADVFAMPGRPTAQFQLNPPTNLAKDLQQSKLQLGIMTGIEYGWMKPEFPGLLPLATVFASDIRLKACVLVRADSPVRGIADLKGKSIALPKRLQFHTHIFLHQTLAKAGSQPKGFFSRIIPSADMNDGIESVVDQEAEAVLIDVDSWNVYRERKPGRSQKLKILLQSPAFPTAAVLYQREAWNDADLQQIQHILCTAHEKAFSRQILNFWRISKFVSYTPEYEQVVREIVHEIPQSISPACLTASE
jgi:ABC-type phosphate/phosphonate transport system substrate-binding protein